MGPGTVMGKILLAVGEAILRQVETAILYRRLTVLKSFFPHKDSDELVSVDEDRIRLVTTPSMRTQTLGLVQKQNT
jgi:hypothetical protein